MRRIRTGDAPVAIGMIQAIARHWPLPRGRVRFVETLLPALRGRPVQLGLGSGLVIPADLAEFGPRIEFVVGPTPPWVLSWDLIEPGTTVIDIGANIGLWGLRAAMRAGPNGVVHCFEPVSRNSRRLREHARLNGLGNVEVHALAVGASRGRATFYEPPPKDSGKGRLVPTPGLRAVPGVEVTTIDDFRETHRVGRISVIKIDVEGAEEQVLRGARESLTGSDAPVVLFEAAGSLAGSAGSSCEAVKLLLVGLGYGIYRFDGFELLPVQTEQEHVQADLLALTPDHFLSFPLLGDLLAGSAPAELGA